MHKDIFKLFIIVNYKHKNAYLVVYFKRKMTYFDVSKFFYKLTLTATAIQPQPVITRLES